MTKAENRAAARAYVAEKSASFRKPSRLSKFDLSRMFSADFLKTNYVITAGWAAAFGVMVLAELALLNLPQIPHRAGIITIALALYGAVKFTSWYPQQAKMAR